MHGSQPQIRGDKLHPHVVSLRGVHRDGAAMLSYFCREKHMRNAGFLEIAVQTQMVVAVSEEEPRP